MTHESTKYALLTAALCLNSPSVSLADPAAPTTAATPATLATGSDNLEEIVVKGVNLEDQVSPLQRKVTSLFGLHANVPFLRGQQAPARRVTTSSPPPCSSTIKSALRSASRNP